MVPIADLLNHNINNNAEWRYNKETRYFEIYAIRNITEGEEVSLNYGRRGNSLNLMNYGFCVENQIVSEYSFTLKLGNEYFPNPHNVNLDLNLSFTGGRVFESLKNYRLLADTDQNYNNIFNYSRPVSLKNEINAIDIVGKILIQKMNEYSTTINVILNLIKEDVSILNNKKVNLSRNKRNIYNVLVEEKYVN